MWLSVTIFMSCTFCSYRLSRIRRRLAVQMRSNCGFVESDTAQDELAKLPFEVGGVAVGEARDGRKPRQRRHQHGVMGKPKQIERLAADPRRIARRNRAFERAGEHRRYQIADLVIEQPRELPVVEMARRHQ